MKLDKLVEGITILSRYFDDPAGRHVGAEHDIIYVYETNNPVSDEDVVKLKELGWHQPEVDEDDDGNAPYDPEEGWGAFV